MSKKDTGIISTSQSVIYSGPLPNAEEFIRYETVKPGTAERILVMAEKEAEHRHEVEKIVVKTTSKLNLTGQIFGFIIALLSIGTIFACLFFNQPLMAIVPAIIALTGLASVFTGKKQ